MPPLFKWAIDNGVIGFLIMLKYAITLFYYSLKNKESEKKDQFKDYVKISQKVPMAREKLTDKNNMPLTEEQLKKMGILAPDSGSDKRKEKTWAEHDP